MTVVVSKTVQFHENVALCFAHLVRSNEAPRPKDFFFSTPRLSALTFEKRAC